MVGLVPGEATREDAAIGILDEPYIPLDSAHALLQGAPSRAVWSGYRLLTTCHGGEMCPLMTEETSIGRQQPVRPAARCRPPCPASSTGGWPPAGQSWSAPGAWAAA